MMFWWNDRLSLEAFIYAGVLAVVAALIIGVVPALKATGPRVQERLRPCDRRATRGPQVRRRLDRRDRHAGRGHGDLPRHRRHARLERLRHRRRRAAAEFPGQRVRRRRG